MKLVKTKRTIKILYANFAMIFAAKNKKRWVVLHFIPVFEALRRFPSGR